MPKTEEKCHISYKWPTGAVQSSDNVCQIELLDILSLRTLFNLEMLIPVLVY